MYNYILFQEKGKGRYPDTYIRYPSQKSAFTSPSPPPLLSPLSDESTSPQPMPPDDALSADMFSNEAVSPSHAKPLNFQLTASKFPKASKSLKEALQARDEELRSSSENMPHPPTPPTLSPPPSKSKTRRVRPPKQANMNEQTRVPIYYSQTGGRKKEVRKEPLQMIKKEVITQRRSSGSTGKLKMLPFIGRT